MHDRQLCRRATLLYSTLLSCPLLSSLQSSREMESQIRIIAQDQLEITLYRSIVTKQDDNDVGTRTNWHKSRIVCESVFSIWNTQFPVSNLATVPYLLRIHSRPVARSKAFALFLSPSSSPVVPLGTYASTLMPMWSDLEQLTLVVACPDADVGTIVIRE